MVPEIRLRQLCEGLIEYNREQILKSVNPKKSLLYHTFNDTVDGNYNFFDQAKELFGRKKQHPRAIRVYPLFARDKAAIPAVHITMPADRQKEGGIGVDKGWQEEEQFEDKTFSFSNSRTFDSTYNIVFTSDNEYEVLIMYYVFRAFLIAVFDLIDLEGFENPQLGGQDLNLYNDIVPSNIFIRALSLQFDHHVHVPELFTENMIADIQQKGYKILTEGN